MPNAKRNSYKFINARRHKDTSCTCRAPTAVPLESLCKILDTLDIETGAVRVPTIDGVVTMPISFHIPGVHDPNPAVII